MILRRYDDVSDNVYGAVIMARTLRVHAVRLQTDHQMATNP